MKKKIKEMFWIIIGRIQYKLGLTISMSETNLSKESITFLKSNQSWFWTKKWQKLEKQADKDIKERRFEKFNLKE